MNAADIISAYVQYIKRCYSVDETRLVLMRAIANSQYFVNYLM